ncbi:MAG: proton-conducting transporter membrane subunit [Chloroflexota bacterium]|nr:proton-conducting transporter membrane subunit [Chloroflexota bacterium]
MTLWFVALPLAIALAVGLLYRFPLVAALLSAITFLALAVGLITLQKAPDLLLAGRLVTLSPGARMGSAFCFTLLALMMVYTYRVPQGDLSYTLTMSAAGLLGASLMIQNNTLKVLALEMGAILGIGLLPVREREDAVLGARSLVLVALSGTLLLAGAWTMESYAPKMGESALLQFSAGVTIMGFTILLGVGPFGLWLTPLFRRGAYLAGVVLHVALGGTLLFFLSGFLQGEDIAQARELVHILLFAGGISSCLLGGLGAAAQRSVSGTLSYAALADLGIVLAGLGLGTPESVATGILHFIYRAVGITVVAMVAGLLRHRFGGDDHEHLAGTWHRAPLLAVALVTGGLSLAGLPPLAGFVTRLGLYRALAAERATWLPAILISSLGPAWAFGRCILAALRPPLVPQGGPAPRHPGLLAFSLGLLLLALGLFPHLLTLLPPPWIDLLTSASAFAL